MDVFEAVRTLLAVRSYRDTPVPDAVVHKIVEAGHMTASGMNAQPWHFIVIQSPDILHQLGALARTGPYIAQAPLAIVVAINKSPLAVADASRAIQSMALTAWAEGLGSNWVGFSGLEADLGMCAVAEGFVDAAAAAAQRNTGLAGEVVVVAVSIHELELAEVAFHAEGAVALCGDLDIGHRSSEAS